jgi:hypothetical protein
MNRRRIPWLLLFLVIVGLAGFFGYSKLGQNARSRRIILGKDVGDDPRPSSNKYRSGYDNYFDRVNHSTMVGVSFTNASAAVAK